MNRKLFLSLAALGLALSPAAFAADDAAKPLTVEKSSQKGMVSGGRVEQVTATVTAVDAANRLVTLKGKKETETIKMGPEVVNFDQIKVGDRRQGHRQPGRRPLPAGARREGRRALGHRHGPGRRRRREAGRRGQGRPQGHGHGLQDRHEDPPRHPDRRRRGAATR